MLSNYSAHNLEQQLRKITQHGFCVMDNFLTQTTVYALANEITVLNDAAQMHEAGTGVHKALNKHLRGDSIYWLNEAEASPTQQTYFGQMETLRLGLNQHLYLGLFALESHLALYPTGTGYKKHIDRFKDMGHQRQTHQPLRQVSCILYLNQDWLSDDGGHLRLYLNQTDKAADMQTLDILPLGGRLVIFLSDIFYHAVLPAGRDRMSLTGWFLTRGD